MEKDNWIMGLSTIKIRTRPKNGRLVASYIHNNSAIILHPQLELFGMNVNNDFT